MTAMDLVTPCDSTSSPCKISESLPCEFSPPKHTSRKRQRVGSDGGKPEKRRDTNALFYRTDPVIKIKNERRQTPPMLSIDGQSTSPALVLASSDVANDDSGSSVMLNSSDSARDVLDIFAEVTVSDLMKQIRQESLTKMYEALGVSLMRDLIQYKVHKVFQDAQCQIISKKLWDEWVRQILRLLVRAAEDCTIKDSLRSSIKTSNVVVGPPTPSSDRGRTRSSSVLAVTQAVTRPTITASSLAIGEAVSDEHTLDPSDKFESSQATADGERPMTTVELNNTLTQTPRIDESIKQKKRGVSVRKQDRKEGFRRCIQLALEKAKVKYTEGDREPWSKRICETFPCGSCLIMYHVTQERRRRHGTTCVKQCDDLAFQNFVFSKWKSWKKRIDFERIKRQLLDGDANCLESREVIDMVEDVRGELVQRCQCKSPEGDGPGEQSMTRRPPIRAAATSFRHGTAIQASAPMPFGATSLIRSKSVPPAARMDVFRESSAILSQAQHQKGTTLLPQQCLDLSRNKSITCLQKVCIYQKQKIPGFCAMVVIGEPPGNPYLATPKDVDLACEYAFRKNVVGYQSPPIHLNRWAFTLSFNNELARDQAIGKRLQLGDRTSPVEPLPSAMSKLFRCDGLEPHKVNEVTKGVRENFAEPLPWIGTTSIPGERGQSLILRFQNAPKLARFWLWNDIAAYRFDPVPKNCLCLTYGASHDLHGVCPLYQIKAPTV